MNAALWVLVPSRGRPRNVERLVRACALTCTADTRLHFGFDEDDPHLEAGVKAAAGHKATVLPRMGLVAWTNHLAAKHAGYCDALGSLGDDMVPLTHGWDTRLLDALAKTPGIAYPNDRRRTDIPEAPFLSSRVAAALGHFFNPVFDHWFGDKALGDVGRLAGCLTYLPDVIVDHRHPTLPGGDPHDQTYEDAAHQLNADLVAYSRWRLFKMPADVEAVRQACDLSPAAG